MIGGSFPMAVPRSHTLRVRSVTEPVDRARLASLGQMSSIFTRSSSSNSLPFDHSMLSRITPSKGLGRRRKLAKLREGHSRRERCSRPSSGRGHRHRLSLYSYARIHTPPIARVLRDSNRGMHERKNSGSAQAGKHRYSSESNWFLLPATNRHP